MQPQSSHVTKIKVRLSPLKSSSPINKTKMVLLVRLVHLRLINSLELTYCWQELLFYVCREQYTFNFSTQRSVIAQHPGSRSMKPLINWKFGVISRRFRIPLCLVGAGPWVRSAANLTERVKGDKKSLINFT